jgi:hypothetical protein
VSRRAPRPYELDGYDGYDGYGVSKVAIALDCRRGQASTGALVSSLSDRAPANSVNPEESTRSIESALRGTMPRDERRFSRHSRTPSRDIKHSKLAKQTVVFVHRSSRQRRSAEVI